MKLKVTPLDIRRKEFKRSVRGYLDEEVDIFLDTVADEVERVCKLNIELEKKVKELEEQAAGHVQIREALEKTLVAAQLQSEEIRSNAQKESQSMLREAEAKAKAVVDDFYAQTRAVQQTLMGLKLLEEDFRSKFKNLLEGYMDLLDEGPVLGAASEGAQGAAVVASEVGPGSEEDPTSDTTEPSVVTSANGTAGGAAAGGAPLPPSLPKTQVSGDEDATVEIGFSSVAREGSVYFGKKEEEDLDDPFPEIGGDKAKPRDFAW